MCNPQGQTLKKKLHVFLHLDGRDARCDDRAEEAILLLPALNHSPGMLCERDKLKPFYFGFICYRSLTFTLTNMDIWI